MRGKIAKAIRKEVVRSLGATTRPKGVPFINYLRNRYRRAKRDYVRA